MTFFFQFSTIANNTCMKYCVPFHEHIYAFLFGVCWVPLLKFLGLYTSVAKDRSGMTPTGWVILFTWLLSVSSVVDAL